MTPEDDEIVRKTIAHELEHALHVPRVDAINILQALSKRGYEVRKKEREKWLEHIQDLAPPLRNGG